MASIEAAERGVGDPHPLGMAPTERADFHTQCGKQLWAAIQLIRKTGVYLGQLAGADVNYVGRAEPCLEPPHGWLHAVSARESSQAWRGSTPLPVSVRR